LKVPEVHTTLDAGEKDHGDAGRELKTGELASLKKRAEGKVKRDLEEKPRGRAIGTDERGLVARRRVRLEKKEGIKGRAEAQARSHQKRQPGVDCTWGSWQDNPKRVTKGKRICVTERFPVFRH